VDRIAEPYIICSWKADPRLYKQFPKPTAVFSLGAGVDHLVSAGLPSDLPVGRMVDPDLTMRMVEYVTFAVLYLHRGITQYVADQRERRWNPAAPPAASDVSVGIMGMGALGRPCAEVLRAIGYDVAGWVRTPKRDTSIPVFAGEQMLGAFLQRTDILVSLLPNTPETGGMIRRATFTMLRRSATLGGPFFVNAGRGQTVTEPDLVACLQEGVLKGAVLDVFAREPLPAESALWTMVNVLITPHAAADSDPKALSRQIMDSIARFERGEPIAHTVDFTRGY
jgi:glyoxylate/hydroxypyruvate reductase A